MTWSAHRSQLLDRLDALERQVALLRAELSPERPAPITEAVKALRATVSGLRYAIPSALVRRVIPLVGWRPLPETPDWVLGLFRFEGRTSVLLDLHRRLDGRATPLSTSMVIVVTKPPEPVGLVVGAVHGIIDVEPEQVTPPPRDIHCAPFVIGSLAGPGDELTHLLSLERLRRELVGLAAGEGR